MSDDNFIPAHGGEGILNDSDVAELKAGIRRVYELMKDCDWHTRQGICKAAGQNGLPAAEGTRRLRDLRPVLKPYGFEVALKRVTGTRSYLYRIQKIGAGS